MDGANTIASATGDIGITVDPQDEVRVRMDNVETGKSEVRSMTPAEVREHEYGHALAHINGVPTGRLNNDASIDAENDFREKKGSPWRRRDHKPDGSSVRRRPGF